MEWHNVLMLLFFITFYNVFYTPTAKIRDVFNQNRSKNMREGLNYEHIDNIGLSNLPRLPSNIKGVGHNECLRKGMYLGEEQRFQNCDLMCNTKGAIYKYLESDDVIIFNGQKLKKGSWCLPAEYNACNLSVSKIIWNDGVDDWSCISRSVLFGGPGNNQIVGCNGTIKNTKTNKTYVNFIPSALRIDDLNEKWTDASGVTQYVYTCGDALDERQNPLITNSLGNRFQLQRNFCAKYLYGSDLAKTDFDKGTCECRGNLTNIYNVPSLPCTSCLHGVGKFSVNSRQSKDALAIAIPCLESTTLAEDINPEHHFTLCGGSKFMGQRIACMTASILLTPSTKQPLKIKSISEDSDLIKRLTAEGKIPKDEIMVN